MRAGKTTERELTALRREVEALREERRASMTAAATQFGVDESVTKPESEDATHLLFDVDWDEVKGIVDDLADELGRITRDRPAIGMAGAFVLGLLIGRMLPR